MDRFQADHKEPANKKTELINRMIDSRKLIFFLTVARKGSYTAAASTLDTVQSAVSHAIQDLERDLNCKLMRRVGRKMVLTESGHALLDQGRNIELAMNAARLACLVAEHNGPRKFYIGACEAISKLILETPLAEMGLLFPDCNFSIIEGSVAAVTESVERRELDLAISLPPNRDSPLRFIPVFSDGMVFIFDKYHPLTGSKCFVGPELKNQRFILFSKESYTTRLVESFFRFNKIQPRSITYCHDMDMIKKLAIKGNCIGVCPDWHITNELAEGTLKSIPLSNPDYRRQWGIIHRGDKEIEQTVKKLLELCTQSIRETMKLGCSIELYHSGGTRKAPAWPAQPAELLQVPAREKKLTPII